jgi:UDPglucose--hexose-1-phosphate uridylyltransferase
VTTVHRRTLRKPDGRCLHLYAARPLPQDLAAPSAGTEPWHPDSHLRWHPLRGEWVVYATHRQRRTFLPSAEQNPLAPARDAAHPTEVPGGPWDVAVFDNLFPALSPQAHAPPAEIVATAPGRGACEVVVFTQDPRGSLGRLPLWHLELLFEVWAERTQALGARADVQYVFPFENRGVEVGVTLPHPHGQIYAYPFVPPIAQRELQMQREHFQRTGRGLLEQLIAAELDDGRRVLYRGGAAAAFVPVCARYAYEVWVAPVRPVPGLAQLDEGERTDFARALKTVLLKLDGLWGVPMPYVLAFHQAPTDGAAHPEAHVHVQIYPPYRMRGRLKYLAGSELGAGVFTADTAPEERAAELQSVEVRID